MRYKLQKIREEFDFTQDYVADYLGMATNSYQRIEYGKNGTSEDNWLKLYELFSGEIPLHMLMENTPKKTTATDTANIGAVRKDTL